MLTKAEEKAAAKVVHRETKGAQALIRLEMEMERAGQGGLGLTGFKLKGPQTEYGEYLIVFHRTDEEGQKLVGFQNGSSAIDVLIGGVNRIRNGQMKWHEDQY